MTTERSEEDFKDVREKFLRGKDGKQQGSERNGCCDGQSRRVLDAEGNNSHLADNVVTPREISQRLNVSRSQRLLVTAGFRLDPLMIERLDIALREQAVIR